VPMSFPGCCGPDINHDIIIYFCLLHNQGGRIKIISIIVHVLCVLLFMNGFMPTVLIVILIFLESIANSGFRELMFHHCVASAGCLIISASYLCFSLCHHNNSDSLFANQRFKRGMIEKYQNTFLGHPFLLFLLQFSSSLPSFLRLNWSSPQIGHFSRSSYSGPRYGMQ
jgi:protein-S-isoprenylcysteine O-methyltransferase Ste14